MPILNKRLDPPLGLLRGSDLPDDMPLDSNVFIPDDRPLHSDVFLPDQKNKDSDVFVPDDMPLDSDVFKVPPGPNTPQQVHITQGNHEGNGVIISWVTPSAPCSNTVRYWSENGKLKKLAEATINTYRFFNYTSGYIHHCLIDDLEVSL